MLSSTLTAELGRIALKKLSELDLHDTARALRSLRRAATGAAVLPAVGAFGVGVALGAGLGVLFAPKSGKETRAAIGAKARALTARLGGRGATVEVRAEPASEENLGRSGPSA
jgi:hypothetical protein